VHMVQGAGVVERVVGVSPKP